MRLRISCLVFALVASLAALYGCSRESSIVENVRLRNNHSIVFAFSHPFDNAEAFADSIRHADMPADSIADTITVTVGDSIYMMGFLRYNSDKIYLYQWILDSLVTDSTGKGKMKK